MSQTAANQFNGSFYGDSIGMVAEPTKSQRHLSLATEAQDQYHGQGDLDPRRGCLRRGVPVGATGFELGLEAGERT